MFASGSVGANGTELVGHAEQRAAVTVRGDAATVGRRAGGTILMGGALTVAMVDGGSHAAPHLRHACNFTPVIICTLYSYA